MQPLYSASVELTDGGRLTVSGCLTENDARRKVLRLAIDAGWKEPSWFQEHILGRVNYRKLFGVDPIDA